jgi:hypothetical protein
MGWFSREFWWARCRTNVDHTVSTNIVSSGPGESEGHMQCVPAKSARLRTDVHAAQLVNCTPRLHRNTYTTNPDIGIWYDLWYL